MIETLLQLSKKGQYFKKLICTIRYILMVYKASHKGTPTLEELKKAPKERHLTSSYNFCSPYTQYALRKSGKYDKMMTEAGKKKVGTKPYGKPANELDRHCMYHDKAFADKKASGGKIRKADRALIAGAEKVAQNPKNPKKLRLQAVAVAKGIGGKIVLEKVGLMRKGSFAEGGEKESKLKRGAKRIFRAIQGKVEPTTIMKAFAKRKATEPKIRGIPPKDKPNYNEDVSTVKPFQKAR
jgi:hypothetical protein